MTSSSNSWGGGDYSFLLQSIEGRISENIVNRTPSSNKSAADESASKRRWSDFQSPLDSMPMSSAKKLKSFAEIDELMILNEQLRDTIARLESERQIAKEEHLRQLKFLDDRCTSLKKESTDRLEKYYEEKKKWQGRHRELELQVKKLSQTTPTATGTSFNSSNSARDDEITQRLKQLETELLNKMAESRENLKAKLAAESKLFETDLELKSLRTVVGTGSMADEAMQEARTLRKQYAELESVHKRTAREHDAMKTKLKNQTLLEEEVSSLKAKLRLAEEKLNTFTQEHIAYQQLLEERSVWSQLFQDIVAQPEHAELIDEAHALTAVRTGSGGATGSGASVSPTAVLQMLSAYQGRCAVLLQGQGQLQQTLAELRRQVRETQSQQQDSEAALQSTQARLETVEQQLRTSLQQGRLYDGEIRSLRSLLETYDLEFRIGKPDAVAVMALKDRLAADLRAELDGARKTALALGAQLKALEGAVEERAAALSAAQRELEEARRELAAAESARHTSATTKEPTAESSAQPTDAAAEAELASLRAQVEGAQRNLEYMQHVTGLDYLPDRTRVLHLAHNPTTGAPAIVTLPTVTELRRQRAAYRGQLSEAQNQLQEAQDAAAAAEQLSSAQAQPAPAPVAPAQPAADIMNLRLKEQFKERIASFREAVYLLTGYKVDMYAAESTPNSLPRLRLRSMYAEKPEDCLLFQMRGDCPELLDTEFASRLSPEILFQLTRFNSVPAFVSAVTLDLVEKQTM